MADDVILESYSKGAEVIGHSSIESEVISFIDRQTRNMFEILIPESCTNYLLRLEAPRYDTWCKIQVITCQ